MGITTIHIANTLCVCLKEHNMVMRTLNDVLIDRKQVLRALYCLIVPYKSLSSRQLLMLFVNVTDYTCMFYLNIMYFVIEERCAQCITCYSTSNVLTLTCNLEVITLYHRRAYHHPKEVLYYWLYNDTLYGCIMRCLAPNICWSLCSFEMNTKSITADLVSMKMKP